MGIYEYLCGPVHVQMCLCTHVVWRPGHSHGYHLQELHLLWGVFHWPGTHQLITCQAGEPQGPSCLYLPSAAITSTCCYSGILCDLVDSSGSKACKANTSPTDYFPQSTIDSNFFFPLLSTGNWTYDSVCAGQLPAHWTPSQPCMFLLKKDLFHGFWDNTSLTKKTE